MSKCDRYPSDFTFFVQLVATTFFHNTLILSENMIQHEQNSVGVCVHCIHSEFGTVNKSGEFTKTHNITAHRFVVPPLQIHAYNTHEPADV